MTPRTLLDDYYSYVQGSGQDTGGFPTGLAFPTPATPTPTATTTTTPSKEQQAIEAWNKLIPDAAKEGAAEGAATSKAVNELAAGDSAASTALFDPLAIQLFFTQAIAPMLQQLQSRLGQQNADFTNMAQANLEHWNLPESYRALYGQSIPRAAAAQNDVIAALSGAAAAGPALDQLMSLVGQARSAQYQAQQAGTTDALTGALDLLQQQKQP